MTSLPIANAVDVECWARMGVWGDRSCPTLKEVVHCHNCSVFGDASRRFLDGQFPPDYLDEWAKRLAVPVEETACDYQSVLVFRLGEEWLALPVAALVEVAMPRPIHRIPHRRGLLSGLVNIRGELQLCVHLDQALGIRSGGNSSANAETSRSARMLVLQSGEDRWVCPVDEVDEVFRFTKGELGEAPATLARSSGRHTSGVFHSRDRAIGFLDEVSLFQMLRGKIR